MDNLFKNNPLCRDDLNPLYSAITQVSAILVISHFFLILLKPVGQSGPIAQILAGVVLGPSVLSRIQQIGEFFLQASSMEYYKFFANTFGVIFMFLIGLEIDVSFWKRNLRQASTIAYAGAILTSILAAALSPIFIKYLEILNNKFAFALLLMVILANTASPVVIQLVADMKLDTSDAGRLAVTSSLVNEMLCVLLFSACSCVANWKNFGNVFFPIFFTVALILLNKYSAIWFNKWDRDRKYVRNWQVALYVVLILFLSMIVEAYGFSSIILCFFAGLMFPREGKTARTLLLKLSYFVHNFLLPIYFGYTGFQLDVSSLASIRNVLVVLSITLLNFGGKVIGTIVACHYLKIPQTNSLIFAFILCLKGHYELALIDTDINSWTWWNTDVRSLLIAVVVLNTLIAGTAISVIARKEERSLSHKQTSLALHDTESELRILACVHGPVHIHGALGLISAFSSSKSTLISPYLVHLVELPQKTKKTLMYHQLNEGDRFDEEDDYGGNDVLEIYDAVDIFTAESKILIHPIKAVSSPEAMFEEVCTTAEDKRVSMIFLPFHKHQRIDGNMETDDEGIRITNTKVLRHAPCSVGILVHRPYTGFQQPHGSQSPQRVATLFFGGSDDCEALACSKWIHIHPLVNLTLIRFLQVPQEEHESLLGSSSSKESRHSSTVTDAACMTDFYNRYIATGVIAYMEKQVSNGAETVAALLELREMYSLFIVGKGGRGNSSITTMLSDWEECPELGTVGDLLASADFNTNASILVIQKHIDSEDDFINDMIP